MAGGVNASLWQSLCSLERQHCASALPALQCTICYRSCHLQLVLTIVRHRRRKITAKSFCNTEVVQLGASVHGFLCVAWPGEVYRNGIHQQRRARVSLVQLIES